MFYIFGVNVFALLFVFSIVCFALYILEYIQGRVSFATKWRDLNVEQWIFFIGSITFPLWLIGMALTVGKY
jgi:hypothetical protein